MKRENRKQKRRYTQFRRPIVSFTNQWYKLNEKGTHNKIKKESRLHTKQHYQIEITDEKNECLFVCKRTTWKVCIVLNEIHIIDTDVSNFLDISSLKLKLLKNIQISAENRLNNIPFLIQKWKISEKLLKIEFDQVAEFYPSPAEFE